MATLLLADMGAQVIKIEPPSGDEMLTLGPRDHFGRPVFYRSLNASKTIRRLNLKDDAQRAAFLELVKNADVVVEGFRPGVMARLGVGYDVLVKVNPRIVMCSISGYGMGTAQAGLAGHDANYLAQTGLLHRNGSDRPMFFDPPVSDAAGSLFAALTILGALYRRNVSGTGCLIDLALADVAMPLQMMQIAAFGANGDIVGRGQTYLNGGAAYYQIYETADGRHLVLGAIEPKFWKIFCTAAERPDWISRHSDPLPQHELRQEIQAFFSPLSAADALHTFVDADCCLSLVKDLGEALSDTHIGERRLVRRSANGDMQALFPVWIDGIPPAPRAPPTEWPDPEGPGAASPPSGSANTQEKGVA
jgi:alpha-methylacyl-CoA racemase